MRRFVPFAVTLAAAIVIACKENLPARLDPGQTYTLRGEITSGVECPMLVVAGDRRFSLSGDLGRFKPGDRVCVRGTIAQMSTCMAGESTIAIRSIAPADSCP